MRSFLLVILINSILTLNLTAQNRANIWYFGNGAGLDFNDGTPTALQNGALMTYEGCSSICDENGALLFYTDGRTIYNRNHVIMDNGYGLMGAMSSTQSAVIVKKPRSKLKYYVFTVDNAGGQDGLRYSIVDMKNNYGLGTVTNQKNIPVLASSCEKIAVIKHWNKSDFWIIAHLFGSDKFYSFLLTSDGLDVTNPVITAIGSDLSSSCLNTLGYLKASPDGHHISNANYYKGTFEIFDFDNKTGRLSNQMIFYPDSISNPYGTEFSPNNKMVYVSDYKTGKIYQYDLSSGDYSIINQSKTLINSVSGYSVNGALQLAPNGKIYYAMNGESYLCVINNPDSTGLKCGFDLTGIFLAYKTSGIGLPTFYSSVFSPESFSVRGLCLGDSTIFSYSGIYYDSLFWNFGDDESGPDNFSTLSNAKHIFSKEGIFTVSLSVFSNGHSDTLVSKVKIYPEIVVNLGQDTSVCSNQGLVLNVEGQYDKCVWSDSSKGPSIGVYKEGVYWVYLKNKCNSASDTISVSVVDCTPDLMMPNVITPNGDGYNDYFIPLRKKNIQGGRIKIFNRWGQLVYENELSKVWEGKINGNLCSEGVYFWVVQFQDFKGDKYINNGSLTVMR